MFGRKKYRRSRRLGGIFPKSIFLVRWSIRILLLFLIVDLFYLGATWPDWKKLALGPVPKSNFMMQYELKRKKNPSLPRLVWRPVKFVDIPQHVQRAVIVGEDARFYTHSGFDLIAIREAVDYNISKKRLAFGASTISQQTVKNLFLSPSRDPLRKWHEVVLTWGMELNLKKRRILEIYLNVTEFGQGIYGVSAAAGYYWGVPVTRLTLRQAAELAATLPSPVKHNPGTRSERFLKRAEKILYWLKKDAASGSARNRVPGR